MILKYKIKVVNLCNFVYLNYFMHLNYNVLKSYICRIKFQKLKSQKDSIKTIF